MLSEEERVNARKSESNYPMTTTSAVASHLLRQCFVCSGTKLASLEVVSRNRGHTCKLKLI